MSKLENHNRNELCQGKFYLHHFKENHTCKVDMVAFLM